MCGHHKEDYEEKMTLECGHQLLGGNWRNAIYDIRFNGKMGFAAPEVSHNVQIRQQATSFLSWLDDGVGIYIQYWTLVLMAVFLGLVGLVTDARNHQAWSIRRSLQNL